MTSIARTPPAFGKRGNGLPQKSRIVASMPVTKLSAPLAKAPAKKRTTAPSRVRAAPAAVFRACAAAFNAPFASLRVAASVSRQNAISALAGFRRARADAKPQAQTAMLNDALAVERNSMRHGSGAGPAPSFNGTVPAVKGRNTVLLPTLPEFDFAAELVAPDPVPQAEAVAFAETFSAPAPHKI